jgi:biopolymer transport protein ExbB
METDAWEILRGFFARGGLVMFPLTGVALTLGYALGYRALTLRRGTRRSLEQSFVEAERRRAAGRRPVRGVLARALSVGLGLRALGLPPARLAVRLEQAFGELGDELARYGVLVQALVIVAPLLGLLGTVGGMIETFDGLGDMALFSQSGGVAGGVSEALFTTEMGLTLAIPGLLVGRALGRRQERLVAELGRLKTLLTRSARGVTA